MANKFKIITALLIGIFAAIFMCNYLLESKVLLSLTITSGVFAYHFVMRLTVGFIINEIFHNDISYDLKWFRTHRFEKKLYSFLKVRKWKKHIPTYLPETFSVDRKFTDIAKATCQAEIVHEVIAVLSFAPILLAIPFEDFWIFASTSVASSLIDMTFVIVQRYNRPRILKMILKGKNK